MSKRKLLLADDSETVQKVVNLTFELEGIEVVTFGDGDSAMSQFSAVAPDVVLADVNMPGLDGYQICQNIKSDDATKDTPVILLVGSFEPFDEQKAMQVGADDYLTKPFQSIRQLVSKVNELLSAKSGNEIDEIHFSDTLEMKEVNFSDADFGDSAMDDEMIQTSQVGSIPADETSKYLTPNNQQFDEDDDSAGKTQPLSAKDWQDIYSQEKKSEESNQTVYELADEPDETVTAVEEEHEEQNFVSPEEIVSEPEEERGFAFVGEQAVEEPVAESYEVQNLDENYSENADDGEFGIQPDDIDHFYREPDYDDEETVEMPQYSSATESNDFEEPEIVSENETGFEIVDQNSFQDTQNFAEENEPVKTDEIESEAESDKVETETESVNVNETGQQAEFAEETSADEAKIETANDDLVSEAENQTESSQVLSSAPILDFDELDLLEVSFPEDRPTSFADVSTENQTSSVEETPSVEETIEVQDEPENVKSQVAEQLSGVNLSAADIDAIADKVVEKLTARLKE